MKGISIVKLTSRHSTAYVHRGMRLIGGRLLFEEILYPICDFLFSRLARRSFASSQKSR